MELWELNACAKAYNRRVKAEHREKLAAAWQTGAFTGAAFAGKLRALKTYIKDESAVKAPAISKDEFERKLKQAQERGGKDGAKRS